MYIYSNGNEYYKDQKLQQFTNKNTQFVNMSFKGKTLIAKKMYIKKDCILCLTEEGEVYKKGLFNFEIQKDTQYEVKKIEKLEFPGYEKIKKIKFGSNHILFLSKNDYVFSLGSNYFGQLGISDVMIPEATKPKQIKYGNEFLKCKKIHAYKDNSFAIDLNKQLYIWGKKDYLMNLYKRNLFRPTQVLIGYFIDDIYHSSGRIIVFANKKNYGKDENITIEISSKINNEKSFENEEIEKNEEENEEENENEIDTNVKNKIQKEEKKNEYENDNAKILLDYEAIALNLYDFIKKVSSDRVIYEKIRSIALDSKPYYYFTSNNLNKLFDDIDEILKNAIQENYQNNYLNPNLMSIPNYKRLQIFALMLSLHISSFYDNIQYYQLQIMNHKQIKSYESLLKKLNVDAQNKKEILFINNLKSLLKNTIVVKTFENFIYQFSIHHYFIKNLDFDKIIKEFNDILNNSKEIETKNFLIQKIYENFCFMQSNFNDSLEKLKTNIKNFVHINNYEKYIFDYLIKTNKNIIELWNYYNYHTKEYLILKNKKMGIEFIYTYFNKIFEVQKKITNDYKKRNNNLKEMYKNIYGENEDEKNNLVSLSNNNNVWEENILKEMLDYEKFEDDVKKIIKEIDKNKEYMTKQIIINYAGSVVETMKLKKLFLSLLLSQKKIKKIK
jgi:hypothetical protein